MRNQATAEEDRAFGVIPAAPWRATDVQPLPGYRLKVRFRDGTEGTADLSRLITGGQAGVFAVLRDPALFAQVYVECGAVAWPGGLDLSPDAMHEAIRAGGEWVPD
jgi:hypothetical protein